MTDPADQARIIAADIETLRQMGYRQELNRRMSGFSNYAVSLSIICILAGGVTSFHQGLCSVGGASIGLGWPLASLLALAFAATMGQVASAFPTAGGLYHWASILGDRGWGWVTAWFNLFALIAVIAAVNVGAYQFTFQALAPFLGYEPGALSETVLFVLQIGIVAAITFSQALLNHWGIRLTTRLTDFSGYWILLVAGGLTVALLACASRLDLGRLVTFANYSGQPKGNAVWPETGSLPWLFALGFMLPLYTITGFDASAHTAEETVGAAHHVPRAIVRSVIVSALFGWIMLAAVVLAIPNMNEAAAQGDNVFHWILRSVLPAWLVLGFVLAIAVAQYVCGLACVTSASRMAYAFARDGGLPWSRALCRVNPRYGSPAIAIWATAALAIVLTMYSPIYTTLASACAILLYLSYALPTLLGLLAYGRSWTDMGPWSLGRWYQPLAVVCLIGCAFLLVIGIQPPNEKAGWIVLGAFGLTGAVWFSVMRHRFQGPPASLLEMHRRTAGRSVEDAAAATPSGPTSSGPGTAPATLSRSDLLQ
ncbi:MAG TPA: amino acid permease [Planctomycetaceae bacterium]|jgi:amino acid transporter|nr:amino acid permease [Planctomycetaceae bacterium]